MFMFFFCWDCRCCQGDCVGQVDGMCWLYGKYDYWLCSVMFFGGFL